MKRKITSLVAIICLFTLCFTLFTACKGNPDKVTDYVEKLNTSDNFYVITTIVRDYTEEEQKIVNEEAEWDKKDAKYKTPILNSLTTEVVVSGDRLQVLHSNNIKNYSYAELPAFEITEKEIDDYINSHKAIKYLDRARAKIRIETEMAKEYNFWDYDNDKYYEVLSDTSVNEYAKFRCWSHTKPAVDKSKDSKKPNGVYEPELGDKMPMDKDKPIPEKEWIVEWKKNSVDTTSNYLTDVRAHYRELVAKFNLSSDNLVWHEADKKLEKAGKDMSGFVYKDGIKPSDDSITNVLVTAKNGTLSIRYKQNGLTYHMSLMNFGTARVSIPVLCPIFDKTANK